VIATHTILMNTPRFTRPIVVALLLAGLVLRLVLALDARHFNPLIDDSFYALSIARNIATGHGVTYAGESTNGFQPLFVFLAVPFYWIAGSRDAVAIHGVLAMLALVGTATGALLYLLLRRLGAGVGALLGLTLWSLSPYVIGQSVNGLETGLTAFFLVASAWCYIGIKDDPAAGPRRAAGLGIWLGLGVLARIDLGLWAAAVAVDWLVAGRAQPLARRLRLLVLSTFTAAIVASPWFLFNIIGFGSPLPTSGSGVRFISLAFGFQFWGRHAEFFDPAAIPTSFYLLSLQSALRDILDALVVPLTIVTERGFLLLTAAAAWVLRRDWWPIARRHPALILFPLLHVVAYTTWIFGQWFYPRYFITTVCVLTLWLALLAGAATRRWPDLTRILPGFCLLLALAMGLLSWNSLPQIHLRGEGGGGEHEHGVTLAAGVIPPGARVGGFQSGALEYYGRQWRVFNLDGVVNRKALAAMQDHRMAAYTRDMQIDWLLDLDWIIHALYTRHAGEPDPMAAWELVHRSGGMCLYRRRPLTPAP